MYNNTNILYRDFKSSFLVIIITEYFLLDSLTSIAFYDYISVETL
uniref:Uncharacterized protein n=1 Tax=Chondria sp. (in: red algae) TaxID=1982705 RepID=A0A1Z1MQN7_9FLOR|nr:hypothetical protein [Chondria sp. (in: red algae)]